MYIAVGGAFGAVLRYLVAGAAQRLGGATFPVGTLVVNVLGCLVIGLLGGMLAGPVLMRDAYRTFLQIGLLGAFTTFSTYGIETFALVNEGSWGLALLNVVASNVCGFGAVWVGYRVAEAWFGP